MTAGIVEARLIRFCFLPGDVPGVCTCYTAVPRKIVPTVRILTSYCPVIVVAVPLLFSCNNVVYDSIGLSRMPWLRTPTYASHVFTSVFPCAGHRSAQSSPLLRAFSDDWEAFRARGHRAMQPWELETTPLLVESSSVSLPVTGNPTVLDRVGHCEVILARRVGPGEVVKELHLLPVSAR